MAISLIARWGSLYSGGDALDLVKRWFFVLWRYCMVLRLIGTLMEIAITQLLERMVSLQNLELENCFILSCMNMGKDKALVKQNKDSAVWNHICSCFVGMNPLKLSYHIACTR